MAFVCIFVCKDTLHIYNLIQKNGTLYEPAILLYETQILMKRNLLIYI